MAMGGGIFATMNKKLPGAYINFVSAKRASSVISERGIAAIPVVASWGKANEVIEISNADFYKKSMALLGYDFSAPELKGLRDLFLHVKTLYLYRVDNGSAKASNTYAEALYGGLRGNDIKIVIAKNVDDESKYDVSTLVGTSTVDVQTVSTAAELVANEFVTFKSGASLTATAATPLTGGTDGQAVTIEQYQAFLEAIESYSFNALGCPVEDETVAKLFVEFTKRMRDEHGVKFQTVVYQYAAADYEGVISVENEVVDKNKAALVFYTTGIAAGCAVNKSNTNHTYLGEYEIKTSYTQAQLAAALEEGKFIYHKVMNEVRVLEDINTLISFTAEKSDDFASNQTIRVLDQIANDIAVIFNDKYLGKIPNNESGRVSLWNDVVSHHKHLEQIQAIEAFDPAKIVVAQGESKKSVIMSDVVTPVNAMHQLYLTVEVK